MDAPRFDALVRTLSAPGPRRRVLAGLAGGLLAALGAKPAAAGPRQNCASDQTLCDGTWAFLCCAGRCVCPTSEGFTGCWCYDFGDFGTCRCYRHPEENRSDFCNPNTA